MTDIDQYLDSHAGRFEDELDELLRIPSVSALPEHRADVRRAAEWVARRFQRLGFASEVIATEGHPLVVAESAPVADAPTVLVYGHYDVQPADPIENGPRRPLSPPGGTATCTPAVRPTTKGKCSPTCSAPRPGFSAAGGCR